MSSFTDYRLLPSGLILTKNVNSHGLVTEVQYGLSQRVDGRFFRFTPVSVQEYDALYPLSTVIQGEGE